jgi:predicted N-formylglutamate amidohydrolase
MDGRSPGKFLIICDHASNRVPEELHDLGLPSSELNRHIAWDIGAAGVAEELSAILGAPAILCGTSRLVIDCNRQLDSRDLIPEVSDGTTVPGNLNLTPSERQYRVEKWFESYHAKIEAAIEARQPSMVISIHSMTPSLAGSWRPWQIALSSHRDRRLSDQVLENLRRPGDVTVGDNEPYDLDPLVDYSIPFHAIRRNLPYLQVEFRQDEVAEPAGQLRWARRFAEALKGIA